MLSLLIHGLIVGALAAVPFELKNMPEPPTIAVTLVEPASSPAEPSPAQPPYIQPVRKPVPSPIKPVTVAPTDVPDSVSSPDEPTLSSEEILVPPSLSAKVMPPPVSRLLPTMAGPERETLLKDPTGKSISISQARAREGATPAPEYPLVAREAGWEGAAVLAVETVGGVASNSLSLMTDAVHNLSDELALAFLLLAYTLRAGLSSHFLRSANIFNSVGLLVISGVLVWQAIERLIHPQPVLGLVPIVAGLIAAAGNWGVARALREASKEDVAIRLAYVHNLGDTLVP